MARYTARQISKSCFSIMSDRKKVGWIRAVEGGYYAVIEKGGEKFTGEAADWRTAFSMAMDAMSPGRHEAIAKHNAIVRAENREIRKRRKALRAEFEAVDPNERGEWLVDRLFKAITEG